MSHYLISAALMVWLLGAIVGWCAGWAARGADHRGWHTDLARQLARAHTDLAEALDELDAARIQQWPSERAPAPAVVHVHLTTPAPWPVMARDTPRFVDAMPVLPAEEVPS